MTETQTGMRPVPLMTLGCDGDKEEMAHPEFDVVHFQLKVQQTSTLATAPIDQGGGPEQTRAAMMNRSTRTWRKIRGLTAHSNTMQRG